MSGRPITRTLRRRDGPQVARCAVSTDPARARRASTRCSNRAISSCCRLISAARSSGAGGVRTSGTHWLCQKLEICTSTTYWIVAFQAPRPVKQRRDGLMWYLRAHGILAFFHYVPLHTSPVDRELGFRGGSLPGHRVDQAATDVSCVFLRDHRTTAKGNRQLSREIYEDVSDVRIAIP